MPENKSSSKVEKAVEVKKAVADPKGRILQTLQVTQVSHPRRPESRELLLLRRLLSPEKGGLKLKINLKESKNSGKKSSASKTTAV
jgi:hypothetical protein